MKIKNLILSVALILGSCSDAVLLAQAESKASEFKKALHCIRNWKQCDRKQRVKVVGYISAALAGAAAVGIGGYWSLKRRQKPATAVPGRRTAGAPVGVAARELERKAPRSSEEQEEEEEGPFVERPITPFTRGYMAVTKPFMDEPTKENFDRLIGYLESKRDELGELRDFRSSTIWNRMRHLEPSKNWYLDELAKQPTKGKGRARRAKALAQRFVFDIASFVKDLDAIIEFEKI